MQKAFYIVLSFLLFPLWGAAQAPATPDISGWKVAKIQDQSTHEPYLDSSFTLGKMYYRDGRQRKAYMNFSYMLRNVCYTERQLVHRLTDADELDSVSYYGRVFRYSPSGEAYEVLATYPNNVQLLLKRSVRVYNSNEQKGAYGTSTVTASVDQKNMYEERNGMSYQLKQDPDITYTVVYTLYVAKGADFVKVPGKVKDVLQLFPDSASRVSMVARAAGSSAKQVDIRTLLDGLLR